jgi:hypothetical protein
MLMAAPLLMVVVPRAGAWDLVSIDIGLAS